MNPEKHPTLMLNTVEQQPFQGGKTGKQGSKGYPLRVDSEVGGTWLL